jgi:hypothetical protein
MVPDFFNFENFNVGIPKPVVTYYIVIPVLPVVLDCQTTFNIYLFLNIDTFKKYQITVLALKYCI